MFLTTQSKAKDWLTMICAVFRTCLRGIERRSIILEASSVADASNHYWYRLMDHCRRTLILIMFEHIREMFTATRGAVD